MLSDYCKQIKKQIQYLDWTRSQVNTNIQARKKNVFHYHNLQLYLDLGMKVTKVHRVLKFSQSAWLKPYIVTCTLF